MITREKPISERQLNLAYNTTTWPADRYGND